MAKIFGDPLTFGGMVESFPNGTEWTQSNISSGTFNTVYSAAGIWVAGSNETGLYHSTDGKSWEQSNISTGKFKAVYNANGLWIAAGENGLYYSVTWEQS